MPENGGGYGSKKRGKSAGKAVPFSASKLSRASKIMEYEQVSAMEGVVCVYIQKCHSQYQYCKHW